MRIFTALLLLFAGTCWLAARQQVVGTIDKNPGKPLVAVPDFRASGAAAPFIATFNRTVQADLENSPLINYVAKTRYPVQIPQQPSDLIAGVAPPSARPVNPQGNRLTDWSQRARLTHVTYADVRDSTRNLIRWGFFLEDDKDMAARNGGQVFESFGTYSEMDSAQMDLVGVFEYLIGNTDWSVIMRHNIRLVQITGRPVLYPVPYDFDFSGLVDASYARPDPRMPIKSVRQRLYRGMCRTPDQISPTLARVMAARDSINQAFATLPDVDPKRLKDVQKYLDEGFKALSTAKDFMAEQQYVCSKTRE